MPLDLAHTRDIAHARTEIVLSRRMLLIYSRPLAESKKIFLSEKNRNTQQEYDDADDNGGSLNRWDII